jgi:hypothetical protein
VVLSLPALKPLRLKNSFVIELSDGMVKFYSPIGITVIEWSNEQSLDYHQICPFSAPLFRPAPNSLPSVRLNTLEAAYQLLGPVFADLEFKGCVAIKNIV